MQSAAWCKVEPLSRRAVLGAGVGALLVGCTGAAAHEGLTIYATTGYLADAARSIAPEALVTTMVGPGGDPHSYQPSTRDIQRIMSADVVLWNGLHLEAQIVDQLRSLGERETAVGEELEPDRLLPWPDSGPDGEPLHDPHVWNAPDLWSEVVTIVGQALAAADPEHQQRHRESAAGYRTQVEAAGERAAELLGALPAHRRTVITGHDAFGYLGDRYDLRVHATDVVSASAQVAPGRISALADLVVEQRVPVIFADNQANPQAITSLREAVGARGWEVAVADEPLYADSLGAEPGVDTYLGAFAHNTRVIARSLGAAP